MQRIVERERHLAAILARKLGAVVVEHALDAETIFALHAQREIA